MPIIEESPVIAQPATPVGPSICMNSADKAGDGTVTVTLSNGAKLGFKHLDGTTTAAVFTPADIEHTFALAANDTLLLSVVEALRSMDVSGTGFPFTVYLNQAQ